ncbi:DUF47 family protein [Dehalococcoidia bacterium]|nr:DUF47 family protein [Dehalococcoidia bacterium]
MRLSMPFLSQKENRFFFLLHQSAMNIQQVAKKFHDLMEHFENIEAKVKEIKDLEEFGDQVIHDITHSLHTTFLTPIDREDILDLAGRLDDVVDAIDEAAQYTLEYGIKTPTDYASQLAVIIVKCADELERATSLLGGGTSKWKEILPMAVEINRLENEADQIASQAMGNLFNNGYDVIDVLKWRDIYNDMEEATDRAEDAANVLEGIVLKHS